jgi:hypothetical protein
MLTPLLSIGTGTSSKSQHFNKKTRPIKNYKKIWRDSTIHPWLIFSPNYPFIGIGSLLKSLSRRYGNMQTFLCM